MEPTTDPQVVETPIEKKISVNLDKFNTVLNLISRQMDVQTATLGSILKINTDIFNQNKEVIADKARTDAYAPAASKPEAKPVQKKEGMAKLLDNMKPSGGLGSILGALFGAGTLALFSPFVVEIGSQILGTIGEKLIDFVGSDTFMDMMGKAFSSGFAQTGIGVLLFGPKFLLGEMIVKAVIGKIEKYFDTDGDGYAEIFGMKVNLDSGAIVSTITLIAGVLLSVVKLRLLAAIASGVAKATFGGLWRRMAGTAAAEVGAQAVAQGGKAASRQGARVAGQAGAQAVAQGGKAASRQGGNAAATFAEREAARRAAIKALTPDQIAELEGKGFKVSPDGTLRQGGKFVPEGVSDDVLKGLKAAEPKGFMARMWQKLLPSEGALGRAGNAVAGGMERAAPSLGKGLGYLGKGLGFLGSLPVAAGIAIVDPSDLGDGTLDGGIDRLLGALAEEYAQTKDIDSIIAKLTAKPNGEPSIAESYGLKNIVTDKKKVIGLMNAIIAGGRPSDETRKLIAQERPAPKPPIAPSSTTAPSVSTSDTAAAAARARNSDRINQAAAGNVAIVSSPTVVDNSVRTGGTTNSSTTVINNYPGLSAQLLAAYLPH